jgi:hypothetical protein
MRLRLGPVALVLLATLTMTTAVSAAVSPASGTSTRTVHREYGQGPVRLGDTTTLKVVFAGHRGDRVRLGDVGRCPVSLRGPDGDPFARSPEGFWRLHEGGRHTFTLTRCDALAEDSLVQLEKLRVAHVSMNGAGTRLSDERGYIDAVRVTVPAAGRLQVSDGDATGDSFAGMLLPNGDWYRFGGFVHTGTYYFQHDRAIASTWGRLRGAGGGGALVTHAGDRVLLISTGPVRVWKSMSLVVPVVLDGPTTALTAGAVPYRELLVEFDAPAGAWVHAELVEPNTSLYLPEFLFGPNGHRFSYGDYWHIPRTAQYLMSVQTDASGTTGEVRMRTIRQVVQPVPTDGTPFALTATEPGEWVMMTPMTLTKDSLYHLAVTSAAATGAWSAVATGQTELHCPRLSNGCGELSWGYVSDTDVESYEFGLPSGLPNPWMVMLRPERGATATVGLKVFPVDSPFLSRPARR